MATTSSSPNRLADQTSAYLRQHMNNPVDWYPWSEEAFERARQNDLPLLISIGYSACHWCHVMEHESFEDLETAQLMNELFVPIKVDREERPDVDQIYMDTVVRLTGHGGWPLTVFCTPEGHPFYAGTYFPPEPRHNLPGFKDVLRSIHDAYRNRRGEVDESAARILDALSARPDGVSEHLPGRTSVEAAANTIMRGADRQHGGFGEAPKFPTPTNLEFLLAALDALDEPSRAAVLQHLVITCQEMARRGLYDHLGGGFHRYCVDALWTIPHFEKMLYDQGLLIQTYVEAWRRTDGRHEELLWPVRETIDYLRREMRGPEGAFHASQDADSEGEEGIFYVWTPAQLRDALADDAEAFAAAYGVNDEGNFERHTTHLVDIERRPRLEFQAERLTLRKLREERVAPGTDRKRVASWNGYTISGLARYAGLLRDAEVLADAVRAADFVLGSMRDDQGRLLRIHDDGRTHVLAFLDDHAAMLDACLDLHWAGAGHRFLAEALGIADAIAGRFFDTSENDLFLTPSDGEPLVHRPRSDHDGATPHASGLAVLGLLRAAALAERNDLQQIAERVIRTHSLLIERAPHAYPTLLRAVWLAQSGVSVAVVIGEPDDPDTLALCHRARRVLGPEDGVVGVRPGERPDRLAASWLLGREPVDGRATAYVCRGVSCSLPVTDAEDLAPLSVPPGSW